jgi:hypothetical protein
MEGGLEACLKLGSPHKNLKHFLSEILKLFGRKFLVLKSQALIMSPFSTNLDSDPNSIN